MDLLARLTTDTIYTIYPSERTARHHQIRSLYIYDRYVAVRTVPLRNNAPFSQSDQKTSGSNPQRIVRRELRTEYAQLTL
jgi:hypothetical protein